MAIRNIVLTGDDILTKKCRTFTEFNPRLHQLLDDMRDTLVDANGLGLAAPQVGVLRRACIVAKELDDGGFEYTELVNPTIVKKEGEECKYEGCLSIPERSGYVARPTKIKVAAQDRNGKAFALDAEGLFARAICHEVDHLDGITINETAQYFLEDLSDEEMEAMGIEMEDEE